MGLGRRAFLSTASSFLIPNWEENQVRHLPMPKLPACATPSRVRAVILNARHRSQELSGPPLIIQFDASHLTHLKLDIVSAPL